MKRLTLLCIAALAAFAPAAAEPPDNAAPHYLAESSSPVEAARKATNPSPARRRSTPFAMPSSSS